MDNIICPHCGKNVQLTEALVHQLSSKIVEEEKQKQKIEFQKEKLEEQASVEKKLRQEFELESKNTKLEAEDALKKQKELEEKLLESQKNQKEREEKIKIEAEKQATDSLRLEKRQYDKKLEDMQKALEDAQRKAKQGSQQTQGEVLELDLEEKLRATFPNDEFLPVPKGFEGGDIWQKVKFKDRVVGSIIWETKRTKAWSNSWVTKLKDDAARISASEAIIVSTVLPENVSDFDRNNGVWITTYAHAISICRYIRFLITTVSTVKSSATHTEDEWGKIRDYMMSDSFKHRMQAHFDGVKALRDGLDAEKRSTILRWKKTEAQIEKLNTNTSNFYGELRAIASNLPELEEIETPLISNGTDENTTAQETLV